MFANTGSVTVDRVSTEWQEDRVGVARQQISVPASYIVPQLP